MSAAADALDRLRAGNRRFVTDQRRLEEQLRQTRLSDLVEGQSPFAAIIGCSDSRVPLEIIFDEGFGALFVVRVAGNVVAPSGIASVEFAAEMFGTRLVVVLGHEHCGAVQATLDALRAPPADPVGHLSSIVERIRPAVAGVLDTYATGEADEETLAREAVRAHVRASAQHLREAPGPVADLIETDGMLVVGATYAMATGAVDFFDGVDGNCHPE